MKLIWEQDMFSSSDEFENVAFCCTVAGACWSLMVSLSDAVVGRRAVTMRITKCCDSCQSMCQRSIWCVHNSSALLTVLVLVGCYQARSRPALLTVLVLVGGYQARSRSTMQILWKCQNCFFVVTLNSPFISQLDFEGWTVKVKVKDAKVAKSLFVSDSNVWVCVWSDWHQLQTTVLQVQQRCAGCDLHSSLKTFLL